MLVGIAALWVLCALFTVAVAHDRGQNAGLWFLAGMILGPIGLIAALFATAGAGGRRPCPHCRESIKAGASKCRYCGSAIDPLLTSG